MTMIELTLRSLELNLIYNDEDKAHRSTLSQHNRINSDIERIDNSFISPKNFVDCVEPIKVEYIKEEIYEDESVEDPLLLKHNN